MTDEKWDDELAQELDGATVLVGLTHNEAGGVRMEQFFGTVMAVDPSHGISLRLEGSREGEFFTLPPDLRAFNSAEPGEYRLRQTGEIVVDPDFTTVWDRTAPKS